MAKRNACANRSIAGSLSAGHAVDGSGDLRFGDHISQPIGADEQLVARLESHEMYIRTGILRFVAQAAGQHVAELAGDLRGHTG